VNFVCGFIFASSVNGTSGKPIGLLRGYAVEKESVEFLVLSFRAC
jgi:hypothetical protein